MKRKELEIKYGKNLIKKIFDNGYLDGCTIAINPDGTEDIPESDITGAIREIKGKKTNQFDWD
jgi:hypothetical protein